VEQQTVYPSLFFTLYVIRRIFADLGQIFLLNKGMCLYVLCYSTERIASLSQWETQIHQLTLGSPEPI